MNNDWTRRKFLKAAGSAASGLLTTPRLSLAHSNLELVGNKRSNQVIVRKAKASESEIYAADELRRWIAEMTGVSLPIVTDEVPMPSHSILLGNTRYTNRVLGVLPDLARLGDDGFRLVNRAPHFVILGSNVRGTLYGVYELLEKYGGCRWYASFHTVIPKRQSWSLPPIDETHIPAFETREPFWFDMFDGDFAARNKVNGNSMRLLAKHGGKVRFGRSLSFVHTAYALVPPAKYFRDHPEYFAEVNGRRLGEMAQLCWTHPDVVNIISERILSAVRDDPTAKFFSVSQNDWDGYCECKSCKTIDDREGTHAGSLLWCVNQVADAVGKEFPNVWIDTLAYVGTQTPPKALRPRKNVVPRLCSIFCEFSKPLNASSYAQNVKFCDDIRGWAAVSNKLSIWDYVTNFGHYVGPFPNFGALQENVRIFRDNNVSGVFEEGAYGGAHAEFAELRAWLLAKLLWNPDANFSALLDDFFSGYFGAAAEPIRTYFDELQALVRAPEPHLFIGSPMDAPFFNDSFFVRATMLFAEAERRVAGDPVTLYRVRMSGIPVLYARTVRWRPMTLRRVVEHNVLKQKGLDPEHAELADELRRRLEEGKVRVSEDGKRHNTLVATLRDRTIGLQLTKLSSASVTAGVTGEEGAVAFSLVRQGEEHISAALGGVDIKLGRVMFDARDAGGWKELERSVAHRGVFRLRHSRHLVSRTPAAFWVEVESLGAVLMDF